MPLSVILADSVKIAVQFTKSLQFIMLNVHFFTFNAFAENTYVLSNDEKQCWIIDPGMYEKREFEAFISFISKEGFQPQAIINTHGHIDHIFGVNALKEFYKIPFGIHKEEQPIIDRAQQTAAMFGLPSTVSPKVDFYIESGEQYSLGDDSLEILFTPGHSPGSISFYYPQGAWVICGDVLFQNSIGRTDLPGGDYDTLITSIKKSLLTLPKNTRVFSGHGASTTIQDEVDNNPFLK